MLANAHKRSWLSGEHYSVDGYTQPPERPRRQRSSLIRKLAIFASVMFNEAWLDCGWRAGVSNQALNVTTESAVLGGILAQLRSAKKPPLTQQDVAQAMKLSASAWSRVEKGETELTVLQLIKVAQVLGTDASTVINLFEATAESLNEAGISVENRTVRNLTATTVALGATVVAGATVPIIGPVLGGLLGGILGRLKANERNR